MTTIIQVNLNLFTNHTIIKVQKIQLRKRYQGNQSLITYFMRQHLLHQFSHPYI